MCNRAIKNCHTRTELMKKKQFTGILETLETLVIIHKSANMGGGMQQLLRTLK